MMIRKMTSATTVLLVGGTSLMLSSTTMAEVQTDTVQFYFTPYGPYPIEEAAENWEFRFNILMDYDDGDGTFEVSTQNGQIDFTVGDFESSHTVQSLSLINVFGDVMEASFIIEDAPYGYGDMAITMECGVVYDFGWIGGFEATVSPYDGLAGGTQIQGDWSAQVVPAPAGVALLGLSGLFGRPRRRG